MKTEQESKSRPGSASLARQLVACFTIYTLSMSIGAGSGFSGVANSQVQSDLRSREILIEK